MGDRVLGEPARATDQGSTETDTDLVLAARTDPRAFGTLYDHYVDTVYRYLYRQTGVAEATEDLTSLTFLRALAALDRFDPRRPVVPWLMRIAHNALVDHRRTAARTMRLSEEIVSVLVAEADLRAGSNVEQAEAFLALPAGLPEDQIWEPDGALYFSSG